ncbi:MAG: DUF5069 domain-containing protein [Candidatus Eremiobacteraeota bacterium]|nr:DUF5069 domain-containing protein [Candidatus Eremiobacteraeota bacterium]
MQAPDLRSGPPPRWSESVNGIAWLPRLAAKARAYDAGTLGMYLYGQSPVDDAFLKRARLDYSSFLDVVRAQSDDVAVLAEIERRSPGATARLRRWSERLPVTAGWFMSILDVDDGYARRSFARIAQRITNACSLPIVFTARMLRRIRR